MCVHKSVICATTQYMSMEKKTNIRTTHPFTFTTPKTQLVVHFKHTRKRVIYLAASKWEFTFAPQ